MLVYKDWGKHLRMGNFWYNLANMLCISKRTGHTIALPEYHAWSYMKHPPRLDEGYPAEAVFPYPTNTYSREAMDYLYDHFGSIANDQIININLGSNNQSEKWFIDEYDCVKEMLRISDEALNNVYSKYQHILGNGKKTIGIGIRRGDFVGHGVFYQIPTSWYLKALQAEFPDWEDCNILFFSDHIEEVKTMFNRENFYFAEPNGTHTHAENFKYYHQNPMEQFILGTLCNHFVGGSSTFTWWQMWYVKHYNGGKVVHSGKNLSDAGEKEFGVNADYYPTDWILHPID